MKTVILKNINKIMRKTIIILLIVFGVNTLSFSQKVTVNSQLDTNKITIGDQFTLTLTLTKPLNENVLFPTLSDTIIKQIEIVNEKDIDTISKNENSISLTKKYTLTCFDSGLFVVPSFQFIINNNDTDSITTAPLILQVNTLQVDTVKKQIADIKKPIEAPITFMEFLNEYYPYILGFVILAALIILWLWYRKKYKKTGTQQAKIEKPKEPAHVIAVRNLENLKTKKLWQNNRTKEYYIELSEILRIYLYNRFNINALEMTSDEIIFQINKLPEASTELKNKAKQFFILADFVKFAKANPLPNEHDTSMKTAFLFVEETKQTNTKTEEKNNSVKPETASIN